MMCTSLMVCGLMHVQPYPALQTWLIVDTLSLQTAVSMVSSVSVLKGFSYSLECLTTEAGKIMDLELFTAPFFLSNNYCSS